MKKTTASLLFLIGLTSPPAFAENNPADPYEGYNRAVFKFNDRPTNTSSPPSHAATAK